VGDVAGGGIRTRNRNSGDGPAVLCAGDMACVCRLFGGYRGWELVAGGWWLGGCSKVVSGRVTWQVGVYAPEIETVGHPHRFVLACPPPRMALLSCLPPGCSPCSLT
jgi:hypothetical protein